MRQLYRALHRSMNSCPSGNGTGWIRLGLLVTAMVLSAGVIPGYADDYAVVAGPCHIRLPEDHGAHPLHRTEWWYYTGNVVTPKGLRFGYQFTIFRTRLTAPEKEDSWPDPSSRWRTSHLFIGHAAVSVLDKTLHIQAERMSRGALGLAGVTEDRNSVVVFLKRWQAEIGLNRHRIRADSEDFSLALDLTPLKIPVFHGDGGYSRKGSDPERASCYYSLTRLQTEGIITVKGKPHPVGGLSWMDHEYSTAPLEPGIRGWDWFSLQLSDNTEVMVGFLRLHGGGTHPASSGTFVDARGTAHHIVFDEMSLEVKKSWQTPTGRATYPVAWALYIPSQNLRLRIIANMENQEMRTQRTTGVDYWEGSVSVTGTAGGESVSGTGYAELTGYGKAFNAPM